MKDFKNDSSAVLSRFGKDKRLHGARTERVGSTGAPRNGSAHTEQERKRTSFNPNFTKDNRIRERAVGSSEMRSEYRHETSHDSSEKRYPSKAGKSAATERTHGYGKPSHAHGRPERGANSSRSFDKHEYGKPQQGRPTKARSGYGHTAVRGSKPYPKYNPAKTDGEIRLNRFVAQSGICSRREADSYITAGLVSVNGTIVTELGTKVLPTDDVRFNGERIQGQKNVYLLLNKPKGYVTTIEDEHADKTVMDLVKGACAERIYPVGRLDKNSLGLLLFTNDGDVTRKLTHPSSNKKKIYEVTLDKPLTRADFDTLADGVTLEDGEAYFDEISYLKDDKKSVGVEIHSGRNRIVRRMFEHLGYKVTKLDRVYYAGLTKKNLKRGAWRFLTDDEVNRLKSGRYE